MAGSDYLSRAACEAMHSRLAVVLVATLGMPVAATGAAAMGDPDITDRVDKEFQRDLAVPFNKVDAQTTEGVVTLSGEVDNLRARERAARIAETVRGVRAVINQIVIEPPKDLSARELRRDVEQALLYDAATEMFEIDVSATAGGKVTLAGNVDSWAERNLAGTVAEGVRGVTAVDNNINVDPVTIRSDSETEADIRRRLHWNTLVDDNLIQVDVDEGVVTLTGTVGSAAERQRAELDAWVGGVKDVDVSDLRVERWARDEELRTKKYVAKGDDEIASAVRDALIYDPRVNKFNIEVKARSGTITLRGIVNNIRAKHAAGSDARNTVGVINVDNLIKVRPVAEIADVTIEENVKEALLLNPYTESYAIEVDVDDQVAYLTGTVTSAFEKAEAENTAFRARGVTEVRNAIQVDYPGTLTYEPYVDDWSIYDYSWYDGGATVVQRSDAAIAAEIDDEIFWSPFVDADDVAVSVDEGVATLTGTVDSWSEYNAARENAFEGGAVTVVNNLVVR